MKTDRIYQMSPSHSSFTGTTTTAKSRWASPSSVAGLLIATTSGVPLVVSPRRAGSFVFNVFVFIRMITRSPVLIPCRLRISWPGQRDITRWWYRGTACSRGNGSSSQSQIRAAHPKRWRNYKLWGQLPTIVLMMVRTRLSSPIFHFIFINGGDDNTASIDLRSLCITASVAATAPPQQSKEQRGGCTTVRRYDSSLPMWKKNVEAPN